MKSKIEKKENKIQVSKSGFYESHFLKNWIETLRTTLNFFFCMYVHIYVYICMQGRIKLWIT